MPYGLEELYIVLFIRWGSLFSRIMGVNFLPASRQRIGLTSILTTAVFVQRQLHVTQPAS